MLWVGNRHLLFISRNNLTWLYKEDRKFFFEITPRYRWPSRRKKKTPEENAEYDKFIRDYKTIFKMEISRDTLKLWSKKLNAITALFATGYQYADS